MVDCQDLGTPQSWERLQSQHHDSLNCMNQAFGGETILVSWFAYAGAGRKVLLLVDFQLMGL